MSLIRKLLEHAWAILTGYSRLNLRMGYLEESIRKSDRYVESHIGTLNNEMGRIDRSLDQVREDVAFIRGKLDK